MSIPSGTSERSLQLVADGDEAGFEVIGVPEVFPLPVQDLQETLPDGAAADQADLVFHGPYPPILSDPRSILGIPMIA